MMRVPAGGWNGVLGTLHLAVRWGGGAAEPSGGPLRLGQSASTETRALQA